MGVDQHQQLQEKPVAQEEGEEAQLGKMAQMERIPHLVSGRQGQAGRALLWVVVETIIPGTLVQVVLVTTEEQEEMEILEMNHVEVPVGLTGEEMEEMVMISHPLLPLQVVGAGEDILVGAGERS